jgi:hypothetical protein
VNKSIIGVIRLRAEEKLGIKSKYGVIDEYMRKWSEKDNEP